MLCKNKVFNIRSCIIFKTGLFMMIKENEIRPNKIFKKYLKLSEKDANSLFKIKKE